MAKKDNGTKEMIDKKKKRDRRGDVGYMLIAAAARLVKRSTRDTKTREGAARDVPFRKVALSRG